MGTKTNQPNSSTTVDDIAKELLKSFHNDLPMDVNKIKSKLKKMGVDDNKKQNIIIKKAMAMLLN